MPVFSFIARHGRLLLVAGLVFGIFANNFAADVREFLPEIVAFLLFLAALRVGPRAAVGALSDLRTALALVLVFQLAVPMAFVAAFPVIGFSGPLATALILMATAPAISGSPNLTIMTGHDPALSLRLLVLGTMLVPLTCLPVFFLVPELGGSGGAVLEAAGRLVVVIGGAGGTAFILRSLFAPAPGENFYVVIDALSAIMMAVIIIALMSAVLPAWQSDPVNLVTVAGLAFLASFGLQIAAWFTTGRLVRAKDRTAQSIAAGCNNMALFLAALPASVTDPMLIYIGCYQIPMYLTPIAMRWLYRPVEKPA